VEQTLIAGCSIGSSKWRCICPDAWFSSTSWCTRKCAVTGRTTTAKANRQRLQSRHQKHSRSKTEGPVGRSSAAADRQGPITPYRRGSQRLRLTSRRFPPPWSLEDTGAAFVAKDGGGQKLGYFMRRSRAGARRRRCSPKTRRGGLRPTWRNCRDCFGGKRAYKTAAFKTAKPPAMSKPTTLPQ